MRNCRNDVNRRGEIRDQLLAVSLMLKEMTSKWRADPTKTIPVTLRLPHSCRKFRIRRPLSSSKGRIGPDLLTVKQMSCATFKKNEGRAHLFCLSFRDVNSNSGSGVLAASG